MQQSVTKVQLKRLHSQYGDSFYLFDKNTFIRNLHDFRSAFEKHYQNVQLAYSVKTNYIPAVIKLARQRGLLAEVVSGLEYELVKRVGYQGNEIIFNGPVKDDEELCRAFEDDAVVQFDSCEEIRVLKQYLCRNPGKKVRCAVRCNFDIGEPERSRFGFDAENGDAEDMYKDLFSIDGCDPIGIHCHFSTPHRSLNSFKKRTEKLIRFAQKVFSGHDLNYINVGGGFFGPLPEHLSNQFSYATPSFEDYGETVAKLMDQQFPSQKPVLIMEPGISVLASTMRFVCRVVSIKKIGKKQVITVTGSLHNIRPTHSSVEMPFHVMKMSQHENKVEGALIGGYTCVRNDILCSSFSGEIQTGDSIVFDHVGAYNIVFKPPFIRGAPAVLMIDEHNPGRDVEMIKENETLDMMFSAYMF